MTSSLDNFELTDKASEVTALYVRAFNAGDPDIVNRLYTDEAVSVWDPDNPLSGQARRESVAEFMAQKPKMTAVVRESYITNDTALMVVDWTIDATDEDGAPVQHTGVGLDVLRRGPDGKWRYAIDNPHGGQ